MRKLLSLFIAALFLPLLSGCGIETVPPGWEGIRVNNVGQRRGTETYPIQTGRVFFNPINEDIYKYPISKQNYVWQGAEAIPFNSTEGTQLTGDVGIVFNVKPGMTPKLFVAYRKDIDILTDTIIRNEVRNSLNREAGQLKVMSIMGPSKALLLDSVTKDLNAGPLGEYISFEMVSFVHAPKAPQEVQDAINAVITAGQKAQQAEATIRTSVAEAEQKMAAARGDSASVAIRASGQAEANRLLQQSLSPQYLEYLKVTRWNGVQPQVVGSGGGIIVGLK